MSAETDYLQRFIDLRRAFDVDPRYHPRATRLRTKMQLGVEITIVEANRCDAYYDARGTFHASISTGQKSYIRSPGSEHIQALGGIGFGTGGTPTARAFLAGLRFPDPIDRWYAFDPASRFWTDDRPFHNNTGTRLASIEISLVPFRLGARPIGTAGALPVQPDDRVHVLVRRPDGQIVILQNITLDQRTQQLYGYGPRMETVDNESLWIISFFIALGPVD